MKKILKLVFILSLLTIAFVACKKDKGEQSTDSSQSETSQASDGYQQVLYVNEAKFNISGDLVVLFSEELDKKQDFKKLVEVEGLDGDITIMPFINKLIIKGDFKKDNPYNVKVSKDIKGVSGTSLTDDFIKYNLYVGKKEPSLSFADSGNVLPSINNKKINFNSVNVSKVKLEVIKVYTNNITQYLKLYSNEYGVNEWELKDDLGDVIFTKEYKIDSKEAEPRLVNEELHIIYISAKLKQNIKELEEAIYVAADIPEINENSVIITSARHYEALMHADESILRVIEGLDFGLSGDLISEDLRICLHQLADITGGQITPHEVLGNIFKHFCIGK
mgnify:CR=1 FL=1